MASPAEEGIRAGQLEARWDGAATVYAEDAKRAAMEIAGCMAEVNHYINSGEYLGAVGAFSGMPDRMTELATLMRLLQREAAKAVR